jgi:hypothetical protein
MDVTFVKEHEDGSATFTFEMTSEEHKIMVTLGIITALKAGIEEGRKYRDKEDYDREVIDD